VPIRVDLGADRFTDGVLAGGGYARYGVNQSVGGALCGGGRENGRVNSTCWGRCSTTRSNASWLAYGKALGLRPCGGLLTHEPGLKALPLHSDSIRWRVCDALGLNAECLSAKLLGLPMRDTPDKTHIRALAIGRSMVIVSRPPRRQYRWSKGQIVCDTAA
jgi:hypothetical protein